MQTKVTSFAWLITAIFSFSMFSLTAQDLPTESPELAVQEDPFASFEFEETTYDFGTIDEGTKVSQVFTFTNTGDVPLIISNARGSCGCTIPQWPRELIMPGETASLTVEFNSKNKIGKRKQKVTLTANTNPPQSYIYLTGTIISQGETDADISDISNDEPKEVLNPDCFVIFPNPSAEILKLKMEESHLGQPATISIYSATGQLMAKREIKAIDGTIAFSVAHYPAGTYIANVQVGERKPEARCFTVIN